MAPRTREELLSTGVMSPALTEALTITPIRDPNPSDPYYGQNDFFAAREHRATRLREMHHLRYLPGPIPEVREEDRQIPVRDGTEIRVRIYRPAAPPSAGSPLIVMCHEGGWSMGDLTDEEVNCRLFAREFGAVCVNVEYRLAPEHIFPTGINDCVDALKWAAKSAGELSANPALGFIVGGGSAGGNIAAVLAHVARDDGLSPPLTGQYLCVPAIACFRDADKMPERFRAEYLSHPLVTPNIDPVFNAHGQDPKKLSEGIMSVLHGDLENPLMVPFLYGKTEQGHRGVPPAYLQVCGLDPLRDEALIYERILREEAGVKTKVDLYPGVGHYFWTNFPKMELSRTFVEDTVKGVRWLLEQTP